MSRAIRAVAACSAAALLQACSSEGGSGGGGGGFFSRGDSPKGKLVAISDGDLMPTVFADGLLFGANSADQREPDRITVIQLPLPEPGDVAMISQSEATNSVLGAPRCLALTSDGQSAVVISTRGDAGAPPYAGKTIGDLPKVCTLTALDISGSPGEAPSVIGTLDLGTGAQTVSMHPDDIAAAVRTSNGQHEVVFARISRGHGVWPLGRFPLIELPASESVSPATIAFSPDGRTVALTALGLDQVLFYEFIHDGGVIGLKKLGEPVDVPNYPMTGSWTPDGRFFVVSCVGWGDGASHSIESPKQGNIAVIRAARPGDASPMNELTSATPTGVSPEGMVVNPDGRSVITGNIRFSFLPETDPRWTNGGSLSLFSLDADTGVLAPRGEFECGGPAPQGLAFDANGKFLFVTDFDAGAVQQWRLTGGRSSPSLEYTGLRVGVARGVHGVAVAP